MAYEMLMQEAQGMSEAELMEVVRFMRFIKGGRSPEATQSREQPVGGDTKRYRTAGGLRGIVMSDDFAEAIKVEWNAEPPCFFAGVMLKS